mgnify:CR=1 FL=1|jgi:hypothetical protein
MKKILQKVIENINNDFEESTLIKNNKIKIDKLKFKQISSNNSNKKISFIDGGNLEVIKSPSICLFFNRVYSTTYCNNKRKKNNIVEFFSLITTFNQDNKIMYKVNYEFTKNKLELNEYIFDSMDKDLMFQNKRIEIHTVGDIIRRLAEIEIINQTDTDFVVLDGSLEQVYPYEKQSFEKINKHIKICALSKTNSTLGSMGRSIIPILSNQSNFTEWQYEFTHNQQYRSFFVKLNKNSDYIFRFDCNLNVNIDEVLSLLKLNSKDPIFLGYPYGLIEADKFARVTNKEQESLKIKLMTIKEFEKLKKYIITKDAHSILDNIS